MRLNFKWPGKLAIVFVGVALIYFGFRQLDSRGYLDKYIGAKMSEREKLFFIGVPLVAVSYLVDTFNTLPTTALRDYLKKYDEQFYSRYRIFF